MSNRTPSPQSHGVRVTAAHLDEAAQWLARRDRGLSEAEERSFQRWRAEAAHAEAWNHLAQPFAALDRAAQLRPADGSPPDADLLRPRPRIARGVLRVAVALATAAAIAFAVWPGGRSQQPTAFPAAQGVVMRHVPEVVSLPDGSTVELKPGTRVQTDFTPEERRVRLDRGDAHFTVAKDAARPFIVTIGNVRVRAVGTAFTISASGAAVEVLVTEGRVRIGDAEGRNLIDATNVAPDPSAPPQAGLPPGLDAGQVAVIPVGATSATPVPIATATSNVVERATAWRSVWLEFGDMPLSDVVREFNREAGGGAQPLLRTADEATGRVLVSGTFRADGIDAFVRLLQTSFGIEATRQPDGSLWLRKSG